ncbi:MAG TPA: ferredoxin [Bosea sp. (in: a-proteobacteria)]|jgi:ferredoxin|nr:ferredoxin [Bosea sp. (in: a-proteobacteria)]
MRIVVDTDHCIASGACVLECPDVFGQEDSGLVTLLQDTLPQHLLDAVNRAMAACPSAVIEIQDD